jgi:hypothetical protein
VSRRPPPPPWHQAVLSTYGFNSTLTLTLLQGLVTVICLDVMKARGWVSFPTFNLKTAWQVRPTGGGRWVGGERTLVLVSVWRRRCRPSRLCSSRTW